MTRFLLEKSYTVHKDRKTLILADYFEFVTQVHEFAVKAVQVLNISKQHKGTRDSLYKIQNLMAKMQ